MKLQLLTPIKQTKKYIVTQVFFKSQNKLQFLVVNVPFFLVGEPMMLNGDLLERCLDDEIL